MARSVHNFIEDPKIAKELNSYISLIVVDCRISIQNTLERGNKNQFFERKQDSRE